MKIKPAEVLFHVIGCTIFLLLPIIFWPGEGGISEFFNDSRAIRGYSVNILVLIFFYLNFYFFIPRLYFKKRYAIFILILIAFYLVIIFLPELIVPFNEPPRRMPPGPEPVGKHLIGSGKWFFRMGHHLVFFLAVVFFSLLIKIHNRLKLTEQEKLHAELSYFKAQINPHFLFNTLNSIYSLAIQKADNTPDAVVKLSGMMRYVLSEASKEMVPLDREIGYITDYIELQRIRFGETVKIDYLPCETAPGKVIAPLLLIPFIENAFKYGVNPEADSNITVRVTLHSSDLHLHVFNYKVQERKEDEAAGGVGVNNARKRLGLIYPGKYKLDISENEIEFKVDLYIDLG
ncbi:MAG: sensor histidine kinase [Prolixibacteraceae bacterium]|jgi:hypothetical protein|nr:sensor histidine kinase [Prolixibacteraceae bacterium]